jgi:hypothetical protein
MSKSLKLQNGDLVIGAGRQYETVSGAAKLAQDLRLWVLERVGTDITTPTLGTTFEGGTIDGRPVEPMIGAVMSEMRVLEVQQQIMNLLTQYQQQQLLKIQSDMHNFNGIHTLPPEEILFEIEDVVVKTFGTTIICRASIRTAAGTQFNITIPTQV